MIGARDTQQLLTPGLRGLPAQVYLGVKLGEERALFVRSKMREVRREMARSLTPNARSLCGRVRFRFSLR